MQIEDKKAGGLFLAPGWTASKKGQVTLRDVIAQKIERLLQQERLGGVRLMLKRRSHIQRSAAPEEALH